MINLLIPFDDQDKNRGFYFQKSQENLSFHLNDLTDVNIKNLDTDSCDANSIDTEIALFEGLPFILVAYLHGIENALLVSDQEYININNSYLFSNTMFYACSCLTAQELGNHLITNGCRVFLGFNQKISCASDETEPHFYHCENAFINNFVSTNNSIRECLAFMYDEYEKMALDLTNNYSLFDASILQNNLSAFVIDGEDDFYNLTKADFMV